MIEHPLQFSRGCSQVMDVGDLRDALLAAVGASASDEEIRWG
jgi:hypothetical protein